MARGKHRKKKPLWKSATPVVAGMALIAGGTFFSMTASEEAALQLDPKMPQALTQATYGATDAELCLNFEELSIKCHVAWEISEHVKVGELISQTPATDIRGAEVRLVYGRGPAEARLPILAGLSEEEARRTLWAAGLTAGSVSSGEAARPVGLVIAASQEPTAALPNGSPVDLTLSSGELMIPDWNGKTKEFVEAEASELGMTVKFKEISSPKTAGTVIDQAKKKKLHPYDKPITVTLAKPEEKKAGVVMPELKGMTKMEATSLLASLGFTKIITEEQESAKAKKEKVIKVSPAEGKTVAPTEAVTLTVEVKK